MNSGLAQKAIQNALKGNWSVALKLNNQLLLDDPRDVDALNRAARAHAELGNIPEARKCAKCVLKIDPFNPIALKSLSKWKNLKKGDVMCSNTANANVFIEEPGKTKSVKLIHMGDSKVISTIEPGTSVQMQASSHRVNIITGNGKYIGRLPDDIAAHIKNLMNLGNDYVVCIKSVEGKCVTVLIKETKRSEKIRHIPSFGKDGIEFIKLAV